MNPDTEVYLSAEENLDDLDKRRASILRKTTSEEKRELHGILKPPSEENLRTLPSILKHRESSEEKETWLQGGSDLLHSILKKSTSEEESCNSGSDAIRPILKVSIIFKCISFKEFYIDASRFVAKFCYLACVGSLVKHFLEMLLKHNVKFLICIKLSNFYIVLNKDLIFLLIIATIVVKPYALNICADFVLFLLPTT